MNVKCFTGGIVSVNAYIVSEDSDAIIIDPGFESNRFEAYLTEKGLTLRAVLLTHGHFDHTGGLTALLEAHPVPVYIGNADLTMVKNPALDGSAFFGLPEDGSRPENLHGLTGGDELFRGKICLRVTACPGHTAGSVAYSIKGADLLFTGDTLFASGVGRTDLPTGDSRTLLAALKMLLGSFPPETCVYPGHGVETTIARERANLSYIL